MHALWEIRFSAAALRLFVSTTGQSDEQRRQEAWTTLTRLQPLPHTSLTHITHAERTPRHGAIDGIAPTRPTDPRTARLREPGTSTRTAQSDTDCCTSWLRLIIQQRATTRHGCRPYTLHLLRLSRLQAVLHTPCDVVHLTQRLQRPRLPCLLLQGPTALGTTLGNAGQHTASCPPPSPPLGVSQPARRSFPVAAAQLGPGSLVVISGVHSLIFLSPGPGPRHQRQGHGR